MVVVISDDYLESKECDFQTKFALSLSPGKLSPALATEEWVGGPQDATFPSLKAIDATLRNSCESLHTRACVHMSIFLCG